MRLAKVSVSRAGVGINDQAHVLLIVAWFLILFVL